MRSEQLIKEVFEAASAGKLDALQSLCATDLTLVNAADRDHHTPLHYAASEGRTEVAVYLLEKGADVNARDRWDMCPLRYGTF